MKYRILLLILAAVSMSGYSQDLQVYNMDSLLQEKASMDRPYLRFLNEPSMSMGIYTLKKGAEDGQEPHKLDEVYLVLEGNASIIVNDKEQTVKKGDLIFVAANAQHKFVNIESDLKLLVFFSTGEID